MARLLDADVAVRQTRSPGSYGAAVAGSSVAPEAAR